MERLIIYISYYSIIAVSYTHLCFLMLFQPFIKMWLGADFLLSNGVVLIICINFYVSGMRRVNITFRDAMGLFWYDRYKPDVYKRQVHV